MLDPAQNINPGARKDFLTIENVDTFLTADGELLRNMHPPCLVWIFDAWKARQEGEGGQFDTHLICIFYRERERERQRVRESRALVFCDFQYYHKSYIWTFHWISSGDSEDMKISSVSVNYFHQFFRFFYISLSQRTLTLGYSRWCQYFLTLNLLKLGCSTGL